MRHDEFRNPGREYRGVTLWMLNDALEPHELRRQVRGFSDAGWGALITRTFNGLGTRYLSDEWHDCVKIIIDESRAVGLKVWLQAGYMPAGVPDLALADQHMVLRRHRRTGARQSEADHEADVLLQTDALLYTAERRGHVLDLLNREACRRYVAGSYTGTLERYSEHFGDTVETVWVDEPHFQPPLLPWSELLPDRFHDSWGYDLVQELPALFDDGGDSFRVRHHYWRTVSAMLVDSYFTEVRDWCESHGLKFSGHLMGEDTLQSQIGWTAGCMPCYETMGLPGIDHLTRSRTWPADLPFITTPKQCSSASNQLGKPEILCEVYGVSSQGLSFQDRKRIADWMMMLGINYRCFHGSFYSMRGERKRIYAPHLSYQQPWWSHNHFEADHFARFSYLMRSGSYAADVLVVHSLESAYGIYDASNVVNPHQRAGEPAEVRRLTELLVSVSDGLLSAHYDFEYGDEALMARHATIDGARLRIGRMTYRAVILPGLTTLRRTTLELLETFINEGGTVFTAGDAPSRIEGEPSSDAAAFAGRLGSVGASVDELRSALRDPAPLRETVIGARAHDLWVHRRDTELGRLVVIHSPRAEEPIQVTLESEDAAGFEVWDLSTGEVRSLGALRVAGPVPGLDLTVASGETVAVLCRREQPRATNRHDAVGRTVRRLELSAPYSLVRSDPNALLLDFCRFRRGDEPWSSRIPVIAVQEILKDEGYRGPVSLEYAFEVEEVPPRAALAVEDGDRAAVTVNGTSIAFSRDAWFRDRSFLTADVSGVLRRGTNRVEFHREFEPPTEPKFRLGALFHTSAAVELEAIAVLGDFELTVAVPSDPPQLGAVRYAPRFALRSESGRTSGDLVADGYPFYAGSATLTASVEVPEPAAGQSVYLTLPALHASLALVRVNGRDMGTICWHPLECDITSALRKGVNRVDVELVGTLRNLYGPHHRPSGEPDQVWRDGWTGRSTPGRRDTDLVAGADWYLRRHSNEIFWTDDYFFVPFGIPPGAAIEVRSRGDKP